MAQVYQYPRASQVRFAEPRADVLLATSGGLGPDGTLVAPRFFDGFLGHAEQVAVALRVCARVARTRFYVPPGMLAAVLRAADPVVTSNGDRLRFESFSACCGVYARLDVLPGALDGAVASRGTTNVDFNIPLNMLIAITGVSGSGKSTLLHQVLYRALAEAKQQSANGNESNARTAAHWEALDGDQYIEEVVLVDQSPIGRTPRSNPVTYIKAFDAMRELFASLPEAKKRGFGPGHFSFNIPGGRCEVCQGDGTVTVEMQFLADVELICEECKGTRYKPQVLEVRYRGKNIHDVLNLTVKESLKFFAEVPKITEKLRSLEEVGLGYLRLGQSATTLSGGEAQRMKLAAHLQPATRDAGRTSGEKFKRRLLYIFDEPTTGLHFDDVSKLLAAFRRLIEAGGSIVVIEHNLEVIKTADWVIDLGPEGGNRGGKIIGVGPPEAIAKLPGSYTGKYLARVLHGNGASPSNGR